MSLQIMSRLSSLAHELYDRVVHRSDTAQSPVPRAVDDTTATLRIIRDEDNAVAQDLAGLDVDRDDDNEVAQDLAGLDEDNEVAQDLAGLDVDQLAYGEDARAIDVDQVSKDSGDLYGVHIVPASDRAQLDDDHAFERGQNWIEALETSAVEGGPEPEQEVVIVDDEDIESPSSDAKDRPVADRGSGGLRGL